MTSSTLATIQPLRRPRLLVTLLLPIILILLVHWSVGWRTLLAPWQSLNPTVLGGMVLLALASYVLRALRLYDHFLPLTRSGFGATVRLVLLHNAANNLAPMRSGEAAFPLLLHRYFQIPLARSLGALLWLRLMDLHALGTIALGALGSLWLHPLVVLSLLSLWLALPLLLYRFRDRSRTLGRKLPPGWQRQLAQAGEGLPRSRAALVRCWGWTLAVWGVKLAAFAWVMQSVAGLPPALGLLGAVGGELTSVLPFHGPAGVGSYEAGVAAVLLPFGAEPERVLTGAVNLHLFLLGLSVLGAGAALLLPGTRRKTDYG